ncbi:hypothetical protein PMKS-002071 [Pichia membranifaciens]|uniref:PUM-HD domain-containing protein n=1 Tax=Pichia membranifaciens TaxID=4926 RepID=A0A1Q2YGC8_9ASCO|nr:hypothetical protein PMKS-002071 [Pichia membranifaciens]
MSDQTTLSSFDDSISQININATTTTTPPMGEFSNQPNQSQMSDTILNTNSASILSKAANINDQLSGRDFDSLPGVLSSLNLDDNAVFSPKIKNTGNPSTPPSDWKVANAWSNANTSNFGGFSTIPEFSSLSAGNLNTAVNNNSHQHSSSGSTASYTRDDNKEGIMHVNNQSSPFNPSQIAATSKGNATVTATNTSTTTATTTDTNNDKNNGTGSTNAANNNNTAANHPINSRNSSFILPDSQLDSYLFEHSITNTPSSSSILSPNKNRNQTFSTPILGETSRRLNYNLSSPNNQPSQLNDFNDNNDTSIADLSQSQVSSALHPALTNDILSGTVAGESLGMGITPTIPGSEQSQINPSFFGNYIPNQFGFLQSSASSAKVPSMNGLQNNLMNPSSPSLNLLPNQMNLNTNPQIRPVFLNSPSMTGNSQQNFLTQNYPYAVDKLNSRPFQDMNKNVMNKDLANNNSNPKDTGFGVNNNGSLKSNNVNNNSANHRNNLGLNSTANIHRKHTSNNKRGEDASRFVNATLNDFSNEIFYLCKDQHGCRFLQRQLELNGDVAATKIFNEIQLNVIELMIDPFGNYLIQKLLERVDETQRTTLVRNASTQFVRIALDPHGTRALQKLVECISTETEFQIIINSLSSYVVLLSRDLNGNHVIQKCLQKLPPNYCNFIFDAACENCVKIAKHRHGCCVLQRCFDHGTPAQCEKLALKVGENAVELSIDPYGNYVVQYVLSMEENRLRIQNDPQSINKIPDTSKSIDFIIAALASNLTKLSTHKFGSNVIEKSLRIPTLAPLLIQELLQNPESLKLLLHDAYGNYVLQTSLDVADDSSFKELSELLKPYLNDVRNTPHGRRILSKLISRGGNAAVFNSGLLNGEPFENFDVSQPNNNVNLSNNNNSNNNSHGRRLNHVHNHGHNHNHSSQHNNHSNNNNHVFNSGYNMNNRVMAMNPSIIAENNDSNHSHNANSSRPINQISRFGY